MIAGRNVAVILLFGTGALAAAATGLTGLRRDVADPGMRRMFGVPEDAVDAARLALPGLLASAWLSAALACASLAGVLPSGPWRLFGPLTAPVVAVAARRMARRGAIDHTSTPIAMPMTGSQVPTGWLLWTYTGLDIAVPGAAPLLLALNSGQVKPGLLAAQLGVSALVLAGALRRRHQPTSSFEHRTAESSDESAVADDRAGQ